MANDLETSPAAAAASTVVDDSIEDACSICLEPFNSDDPPADATQQNDSDFEERIMRHFAAATSRVRLVNRRRRQASSGIGPTQVVPSVPVGVGSNQTQNNESTVQFQGFGFFGDGSAASATSSSIRPASSSVPAHGSDPSKLRYKDSISKGTRGFKEKLLARNTTVKEFGKEVQREMSAGIAGVSRMIERLDLTSKRTGAAEPSACIMGTSNFPGRGVSEQGNVTFQARDGCRKNSTIGVCSWSNNILSSGEALLFSVFIIPDVANMLFYFVIHSFCWMFLLPLNGKLNSEA
ncbi:hypothetical protein KY284_001766 [Solanum tuberosum]|nr:hypothetical protein KY284_001766 [Solanum tuberosum]